MHHRKHMSHDHSLARQSDLQKTPLPLLLRNLAMDCLPRICLRGNLFTTRCLAVGVRVTISFVSSV
jgi:hypothetical protein